MEDARKPKRWLRKLSLAVLVLAAILLGGGLALLWRAEQRERHAYELFNNGGRLFTNFGGPSWLARWFPDPSDGAHIERLGRFDRITWLDMWGRNLSDEELKALAGLNHLGVLHLNHSNMTDEGLKSLARSPSLVRLALDETQITDEGLKSLAGLTRMRHLLLSGTKITDEGLKHLVGMSNLQTLKLSDTQVTDEGLKHVAGLTDLQWLWVDGTKVTPEGVRELQKALPNCAINPESWNP
jgi:hypothetical protein